MTGRSTHAARLPVIYAAIVSASRTSRALRNDRDIDVRRDTWNFPRAKEKESTSMQIFVKTLTGTNDDHRHDSTTHGCVCGACGHVATATTAAAAERAYERDEPIRSEHGSECHDSSSHRPTRLDPDMLTATAATVAPHSSACTHTNTAEQTRHTGGAHRQTSACRYANASGAAPTTQPTQTPAPRASAAPTAAATAHMPTDPHTTT